MGHSRRLISCPACESTLIQIECRHVDGEARADLERDCPECGHQDELTVSVAVAEVLEQHAAELALSLEQLANRLEAAAELWISR
jgi:transcriptional regulator NrdR family protein